MDEKTKNPTLEIKEILDEIDSLDNQAGSDPELTKSYRQVLLGRLSSKFDLNPELRTKPNPSIVRAIGILAKENKAEITPELVYSTKGHDITPRTASGEGYLGGELYDRLSPESKNDIDKFMLSLLDVDRANQGKPFNSLEELAALTGISVDELRGAYGLLDGVDDGDSGIITHNLIDLDKDIGLNPSPASNAPEETDSDEVGEDEKNDDDEEDEDEAPKIPLIGRKPDEPYVLSDFYIARIKSDVGRVVSIVLETIPYVEKNAVYVIRNDDDRWSGGIHDITNKQEARRRGAVRRVYHTKLDGGQVDTDGVVRRINALLNMPFDKFNS